MEQVSVKYIGKRAQYTEAAYGTRIVFLQGQSRLVPADKARLLLRHPDVYVPGAADAASSVVAADLHEADDVQDMRDAIAIMDKEALSVYAKTHFQINIDKRKAVDTLRAEVTSMVDRFGAI